MPAPNTKVRIAEAVRELARRGEAVEQVDVTTKYRTLLPNRERRTPTGHYFVDVGEYEWTTYTKDHPKDEYGTYRTSRQRTFAFDTGDVANNTNPGAAAVVRPDGNLTNYSDMNDIAAKLDRMVGKVDGS